MVKPECGLRIRLCVCVCNKRPHVDGCVVVVQEPVLIYKGIQLKCSGLMSHQETNLPFSDSEK